MSDIDDEGDGPRVHRVKSAAAEAREAQMGLDDLVRRGQAMLSREARDRAARQTEEELESVRQRRIRQAQALADRFEWKPVACVIMFEIQICRSCGCIHQSFRGYGTLYHRKYDPAERISKAECVDFGLPRQKRELVEHTQICADCVDEVLAPSVLIPADFIPIRKTED